MDWKQEAAVKLMQYEARRQSLESIPAEIKRLELDYQTLRSSVANGTPISGGGTSEDSILSNIVRREELARQLESAKAWCALVDAAMAVLDDRERLVLDRFYIHRGKGAVARLMDELNREKAQVYRYRDHALRHFTLALYGAVET